MEDILIFALTILADMAKLVDVPDLGSGAARRVGSSPIIRTKKASHLRSFFYITKSNKKPFHKKGSICDDFI